MSFISVLALVLMVLCAIPIAQLLIVGVFLLTRSLILGIVALVDKAIN